MESWWIEEIPVATEVMFRRSQLAMVGRATALLRFTYTRSTRTDRPGLRRCALTTLYQWGPESRPLYQLHHALVLVILVEWLLASKIISVRKGGQGRVYGGSEECCRRSRPGSRIGTAPRSGMRGMRPGSPMAG